MEGSEVRRLALVLAVQAEIEGMKAENLIREQNNESPAYGREQFSDMASELRNLAYGHV
ncbi:hypothetical protein [Flavobacterium sp. 102]|uniref:hypothetical protein n=1 Tax=Flavobacterium sp. 102 TaxID=2135623 RepID=UPI000F117F9E|nr:hypothetical protein [Flavobacterium sp. 102]RKS00459.1 hypothetical protein C8C84_0069 [Flavobacterium sp. 102]